MVGVCGNIGWKFHCKYIKYNNQPDSQHEIDDKIMRKTTTTTYDNSDKKQMLRVGEQDGEGEEWILQWRKKK